MATLTTVDLVEEALGKTLNPDETSRVQYYIKLISTYITTYTGFAINDESIDESPDSDAQTVRFKADYFGIVYLQGGPVEDVTSVKMWGSQGEHLSWQWDGLNQVFGLRPMEVVDITFVQGHLTVPEDLEMVATEAVKRLFESPTGDATGPATKIRVGDVERGYRAVDVGSLSGYFNDFEKLILNRYRGTISTVHLGFAQQPNFEGLPAEGSDSIVE